MQRAAGGNALIEWQLYPLQRQARFEQVRVTPRMVYVDANRPDLAEGVIKKAFIAMIAGVREPAIQAGMIEPDTSMQAFGRCTEPLSQMGFSATL